MDPNVFIITRKSKYSADCRDLIVRDSIGLKDGVNLLVKRGGIPGDEVAAGLNLPVDDVRALAHDLLTRIGDPVPVQSARPIEVGDFIRRHALYRATLTGRGDWADNVYRVTEISESASHLGRMLQVETIDGETTFIAEHYVERVDVEVIIREQEWRVVE